jgi:hypothetical protein
MPMPKRECLLCESRQPLASVSRSLRTSAGAPGSLGRISPDHGFSREPGRTARTLVIAFFFLTRAVKLIGIRRFPIARRGAHALFSPVEFAPKNPKKWREFSAQKNAGKI